jgi:DNA-repair protein complementing XP-A cells
LHEDGGFIREEESNNPRLRKVEDEAVRLPLTENKKCRYCGTFPINQEVERVFDIYVCTNCRFRKLEFITKTRCRSEYLLSTEELNSFRCLLRPNPHKGTWSDMNLYLKEEIESFAIKKYIFYERIEEIKEERKSKLMERKKKKLKKKIRDLKRKTRLDERELPKRHEHEFMDVDGACTCSCGLIIEQEEF